MRSTSTVRVMKSQSEAKGPCASRSARTAVTGRSPMPLIAAMLMRSPPSGSTSIRAVLRLMSMVRVSMPIRRASTMARASGLTAPRSFAGSCWSTLMSAARNSDGYLALRYACL